ncbi:hypothetical protein ABFA07_017115 [Porites harrisoni]
MKPHIGSEVNLLT